MSSIDVGGTYEFHSTSAADLNVAPFSGESVVVIRKLRSGVDFDEEVEQMYEVRFPDGHTAFVFEGEINGYYRDTGQHVGAWS